MHLSNFLFSSSINLSLTPHEKHAALEEVMSLLRYDKRIVDWNEFSQKIMATPGFSFPVNEKQAVMIYHGRTNSIRDLVISVGRSKEGISFQESIQPVNFLFVIGIPSALNNEYLRMMGAIARICKNESTFKKLLLTENGDEFIAMLSDENN
ncbi:MAG: PTS sugar transporter subunit IIA [Chthoniobacterales bacterium]